MTLLGWGTLVLLAINTWHAMRSNRGSPSPMRRTWLSWTLPLLLQAVSPMVGSSPSTTASSGRGSIDAFASAAGLTDLDYVVLMPDVETCVERVLSRSGHGFRDEAAARKMHAEFAAAIVEPRHVLATDSESVVEVADRISAALEAGHLRYSLAPG